MRLKNQAELLQMCYEKNVELGELQEENKRLKEREEKAKEIIREYIRITYEEFSNEFDARFANRNLLEKAEVFLKE